MFHSSPESILQTKSKVTYFAICIPPAALEHALLRQPPFAQAYKEALDAAKSENPNNKLDLKNEFHCTLQFFSPPKDPSVPDQAAEVMNLMTLVGKQVQMTVSYVAFTPKIIAARLNIISPSTVALACNNACPHITISVGNSAQAVWSNELLCAIEGKVSPSSSNSSNSSNNKKAKSAAAAELTPEMAAVATGTYDQRLENFWKHANVLNLQNTNMMTVISGQVCAFSNTSSGGNNKNAPPPVSPRLLSPQVTPSTSPSTTPTRGKSAGKRSKSSNAANKKNEMSNSAVADPTIDERYPERNIRSTNPVRSRATESPVKEVVVATGSASSQQESQIPVVRTTATTNSSSNNSALNPMMVANASNSSGTSESPMRRESTMQG